MLISTNWCGKLKLESVTAKAKARVEINSAMTLVKTNNTKETHNIYDPKLLVCKDDFDHNDICGICQNICNTATDIGCKNGDIFCKSCIFKICKNCVNKSKIRCPSCADYVRKDKISVNKYAIKSISKYTIRCLFSDLAGNNNDDDYDEGKVIVTDNEHCSWTGKISEALDHIKTCEFAAIECKHCHSKMRRNHLEKHELDCTMFPVQCLLKCNKMVIRSEMNKHMEHECMESFIVCQNKECNDKIQRKHIEKHILECEYNVICCEYHKYGCHDKIFKKDMETHIQEKQVAHLQLKINQMEKTIDSLKNVTATATESDFAIVFESSSNDNKLSSYIATVNIDKRKSNDYYTFSRDNIWIKNVDASYCATRLKDCNLFDYSNHSPSDDGTGNVIIRVGGKNESTPNVAYVVESGDYMRLPDLTIPRYGCHSIYSNLYGLISVGGRSQKSHHPLSSFEVLSVVESKQEEEKGKESTDMGLSWAICGKQQCMSKARCVPSLCLLNGKLIVCGGSNDDYDDNASKNPTSKSCEIFDNDTRKWSFLSNMNHNYCAAGICTIDDTRIAIAVDYQAEIYDSHKNEWFSIPNMHSKHTLHPLLFMNEKCNNILIIVGNDGTSKNINKWGDIEFIDLRIESKGWMKFSSVAEFLKFDKYDCRNRYFQQICKLN